jgi:hypothetical protein
VTITKRASVTSPSLRERERVSGAPRVVEIDDVIVSLLLGDSYVTVQAASKCTSIRYCRSLVATYWV